MKIYRKIGNDNKYLEMRKADLKYGNDYHDLATFYFEKGGTEKAIKIAYEGLEKGEGNKSDLKKFLKNSK